MFLHRLSWRLAATIGVLALSALLVLADPATARSAHPTITPPAACPTVCPTFRTGCYYPSAFGGFYPNVVSAVYFIPGAYVDNHVNVTVVNNLPPARADDTASTVIPPPRLAPAPAPVPAPAPLPVGAAAEIDLTVPAGAVVWLQGIKVKQTGSVRYLVTPPLVPGQTYSYEIRATYPEKGQDVTTVRTLGVRAGDRLEALLLALPIVPAVPAAARAQR